jgi:hypothetical protein
MRDLRAKIYPARPAVLRTVRGKWSTRRKALMGGATAMIAVEAFRTIREIALLWFKLRR